MSALVLKTTTVGSHTPERKNPRICFVPAMQGTPFNPKTICILVVDDEATSRMVTRKILERTGYNGTSILAAYNNISCNVTAFNGTVEVEVVESGRKALEMLDKKKINLILCDLHMPDLDGIGVVRKVRERADLEECPIVSKFLSLDLELAHPDRFINHHIIITHKEKEREVVFSLSTFLHISNCAVMSATEDLDIVYKCLKEGADDYLIKVNAFFRVQTTSFCANCSLVLN